MMEQSEKFNDWLFRYQYVYRIRRTEKQKRRFLSALVTDIAAMREDVQVIEYDQSKKYASSNVYVGDLEKADQIICTYYDTPPQHFGPYYFFDRKRQSKGTMSFILVSSLLTLLVGGIGTLIYMMNSANAFDLSSMSTIFVMIGYGIYFFLLGKVAKGLSSRKTLIRNTSSILTLLAMMAESQKKRTAFAFIDEGSFGERGLEAMKTSCKKSAKIVFLDSVGADAQLQYMGDGIRKELLAQLDITQSPSKNSFNYLFSAETSNTEQETHYFLTKTALNQKKLNLENITKIIDLYK